MISIIFTPFNELHLSSTFPPSPALFSSAQLSPHTDGTPRHVSPLELVLLVPDVIGLVVAEELGDACRQVAVNAVHVAGCSHDGAHVLVAVLDAFLHLNNDIDTPLSQGV